jgi:hypothetical protein
MSPARKRALLAALGALLFLTPAAAQGQSKGKADAKVQPLTAMDYIEIQQLVAKYAFALDTCGNKGQDYADLYTEDGVFTSGETGQEWRGRQGLIEAAGGPGCERLATRPYMSHTTPNLVIEPSPEGAKGKSYLVYPGVGGKFFDAPHTGHAGGYQDVYVKTPDGWRFKSRVHVYAPQIPGEYTGTPNSKLAKGSGQ